MGVLKDLAVIGGSGLLLGLMLTTCPDRAIAQHKPPVPKKARAPIVMALPIVYGDGILAQCAVKGTTIRCGYVAKATKCVYVLEAEVLCGNECRWTVIAKECAPKTDPQSKPQDTEKQPDMEI